ncbi:hypothetical protein QAD02_011550 [Eretmocerus hayati]|uniref:Uncharacterized protein n=1 Tax=Eretmocerus hayati TaxID=131215 RepID=A0ACC2NXG4_9HYME|nr:hypothetical protein QAD02_011550 [Eretmocerus hayati]
MDAHIDTRVNVMNESSIYEEVFGLVQNQEEVIQSCFQATRVYLVPLYLSIFGSVKFWKYAYYGTKIDPGTLPNSKLYKLQWILVHLVPLLKIFECINDYINTAEAYTRQQQIILASISVLTYSYSTALIYVERNKLLPGPAPRHHSAALLGFWILDLVIQTFNLLRNFTKQSHIEKALSILCYTGIFLRLVVGLLAPGIVGQSSQKSDKAPDADKKSDEDKESEDNEEDKKVTWSQIQTILWDIYDWTLVEGDSWLYAIDLSCFFCVVILGKAINYIVLVYNKHIIDSIVDKSQDFRWDLVLTYITFKFLHDNDVGGSLLKRLQRTSWGRIENRIAERIQIKVFSHLQALSLRYHLGRKTGEVLRIVDSCQWIVTHFLEHILLRTIPSILDVVSGLIFFVNNFGTAYGSSIFTCMMIYIVGTLYFESWISDLYWKKQKSFDYAKVTRCVESLLNFETVKYFGGEKYEIQRFKEIIRQNNKRDWTHTIVTNLINLIQGASYSVGFLVFLRLSIDSSENPGAQTAGDYVLHTSYFKKLYSPLDTVISFYSTMRYYVHSIQDLSAVLHEKIEILDAPNAKPLNVSQGCIEFSEVSFRYTPDGKEVLKRISLTVPAGKTVAFVGHSGAGKSTIMRLLFRFYDVTEGAIVIDGQNIKDVTQDSLRQAIGVVPQDTVLFNDTIAYNIEYGRIGATKEEIEEAAKLADIHERILTFEKKYETMVGERGLRLSGGEKQRVAIARTILKAPKIVLLDEATSALDTHTERNIQSALGRVCANRTTLIIAHRLSTVIHADEILVMNEGEIVQRGRHQELSEKDGPYRELWLAQLKNEKREHSSQNCDNENGEMKVPSET